MHSDPPIENSARRRQRLRALVELHRVSYDIRTARAPAANDLDYVVALVARDAARPCLGAPTDCNRCQAIWIDLAIVARSVLPRAGSETRLAIRPFDHSTHHARVQFSTELELLIDVRRRQGCDAGVEDLDLEDRVLRRLLDNLEALGIRPAT